MKREVLTQMKINTIKHSFGDAFKSLKRNSAISVASMFTVLITFVILGIFLLIAQNANLAISGIQSKIEIQVYLKDDITLINQRDIQVTLDEQSGVSDVSYESKEDAFNKFEESTKENKGLLQGYTLEKNPFPASYIVKIDDPSQIDGIISNVKDMNGVESIENQQDLINTITGIVKGVRVVGLVLFIILVAVSIFLIMNTTKLAVYARRREVSIMKFVGATDWFIRWPFIIEGMIIGLVGTVLSSFAVFGLYKIVVNKIVSQMILVNLVNPSYVLTNMVWQFAIGGIIVGGIASYGALRKFLVV